MKKYLLHCMMALFIFSLYTTTYAEKSHAHEHVEHDDDYQGHKNHSGNGNDEVGIKLSSEAMEEFGIEVAVAGPGTLKLYTILPGEVQVNQDEQAHIVPRYPGLVVEVRKRIGDKVKKGDVLAILEGNESLAPYALKSLINGTIIEKHITVGESLKEDDVAFIIANLVTIWIDLTIYQKDLAAIKVGQEVFISGGQHQPMEVGTISYVSPTLDKHTRTGHARIVLPNPNGSWKPGLFVSGSITVSSKNINILIPNSAIQTLKGKSNVFVKTGEGFMPRPIQLGRQNKSSAEILSGLAIGERYVSHGGFTLKAEMARGQLEHAGHAH